VPSRAGRGAKSPERRQPPEAARHRCPRSAHRGEHHYSLEWPVLVVVDPRGDTRIRRSGAAAAGDAHGRAGRRSVRLGDPRTWLSLGGQSLSCGGSSRRGVCTSSRLPGGFLNFSELLGRRWFGGRVPQRSPCEVGREGQEPPRGRIPLAGVPGWLWPRPGPGVSGPGRFRVRASWAVVGHTGVHVRPRGGGTGWLAGELGPAVTPGCTRAHTGRRRRPSSPARPGA
jgi:hypothetical protein